MTKCLASQLSATGGKSQNCRLIPCTWEARELPHGCPIIWTLNSVNNLIMMMNTVVWMKNEEWLSEVSGMWILGPQLVELFGGHIGGVSLLENVPYWRWELRVKILTCFYAALSVTILGWETETSVETLPVLRVRAQMLSDGRARHLPPCILAHSAASALESHCS